MEFRNYKTQFLVRITILVLALAAFVYSLIILHNFMRSLFSAVFCIISILEFFSFLNNINREFKSFLQALIYEDFSNYYSTKQKDKEEIYRLFNKLNSKYRKISFEKEVQYALITTIIEHISIGIAVFDNEKNIELKNNNLLKLFKCNSIKNLNDIIIKIPQLKDKIEFAHPLKPELIELNIEGELLKLSMNTSKFKLEGKPYTLISFQNINIELDEQELLAWQKLIRVLTHEIMNSVTPISSLTSSLNTLLSKSVKDNRIEQKHLDYLISGLAAVQDRSEGLIKFTESYKKLTQLKHPDYAMLNVKSLIENVIVLHKSDIEKHNIQLRILVDEYLEILADKFMIEQVFINLVKNAIEATQNINSPSITIKCFTENERLTIQVIDNGAGISNDKIDKIFIPFFTTKDKGSGIGLSFVRQVMRLHRGNVFVKSRAGETIFTLKF